MTNAFQQAKEDAEAFIADQTQKDYRHWRERFGLTKEQVDNERKAAAERPSL